MYLILKAGRLMASNDQTYGVFRALSLANMTVDEVEIVDLDYPSAVIALKNGAIDAAFSLSHTSRKPLTVIRQLCCYQHRITSLTLSILSIMVQRSLIRILNLAGGLWSPTSRE